MQVLDFILCCFVALASEEARDISSLSSQNDFMETIVGMLATHASKDPLHSNTVKLTKIERMTVSSLKICIVTAKC